MTRARVAMVLLLSGLALGARAGAPEKAPPSSAVGSWLVAGPLAAPALLYGSEPGGGTGRLLGASSLDPRTLWPSVGDPLSWAPGAQSAWKTVEARDGAVGGGKAGEVLYAATYLRTRQWTKALLRLDTSGAVAVYLDGASVGQRLKLDSDRKEPERFDSELVLPTGLHRLLVVARGEKAGPAFRAALSLPAGDSASLPEVTLSSRHPLGQDDVLAAEFVTELALSGDGAKVAAVVRRTDRETDARVTWIEVRDTADGRLLLNWKAAQGLASPSLSPDGHRLFFTAKSGQDKEARDLWCLDLGSGAARLLAEKLKGVKKLQCDGAGEFLYFLAFAPKEKPAKEPPAVRFTEMYQRWSDWNDRPQLYQLSLKDRVLRPLTAGATNVQDYALSADGRQVAVVRTRFVRERPYLSGEVWVQDLGGGAGRRLLAWPRWPDLSEIAFSPDGRRLALVAPPSDMPPGGAKPQEHMAYDLSLFVLDAAGGPPARLLEKVRPTATSQVTGALPGRRNLWWSPKDGKIYLVVTDRDRVRLLRTDAEGKAPEAVPLPDATLGTPELASSGAGFVWNGSSFGTFWTVRYADLATGRIRDLAQAGREVYARVELGGQEPFDLLARDGTPVQGWLFYPPDFDAAKKYPLIVAYYGGVSPYAECFRPEFFWLAGQGYVVYLVTPRGSVGYGREFADAHMNDWGREAGADILEGVRAVLKTKTFLDPKRVGCYGGSYGGFMTLYLVSHSDLFAAAVDFFGISDLASYWGAGWWGWNYGDTAMANSYPWNRKELFVEQSPLFSADKIHAATLLLHGDSDTNVPPQESDQIFTALRVLGRTCEYVRFAGEDHGISGKPSVRVGSETMMLEWFDKHLKGQGEAWGERWKDDPVAIEKE